MGPPVPSSADRQWSEAFSAYERSRPKEITPEQGYEAAQRDDAQRRRLLQSMGIDPDMLQKQLQEVKQRGEERGRYYEQQAEDIRGNARENAVMNFLLSASGRRLGDVMGSAARGSIAARTAAETQAQRFMDLKIQAQDAAAKESMLIDRMRYETAMGQFDKAMKTRQDIEANRQKYEAAGAELRRERAKDLSAEERQRLDREMEAQRSAVTQRGQDLQYLASMQRSSGASNPRAVYDTINDNVQRRMDAWAKSREGILAAKDPSTVAAKRQEFVAQAVREAQALGVAIPSEVVRAFEQGTTGGANKATNVDLSQFNVTKE
jgi:hypothetical protein